MRNLAPITGLAVAARHWGGAVNKLRWLTAAFAACAFVLPVLAAERPYKEGMAPQVSPRSISDPLLAVYRTSGVRDDGGLEDEGLATVFNCTNVTNTANYIRFRIWDDNGVLVVDKNYTVNGGRTFTAVTHATNGLFFLDAFLLAPGVTLNQGFVVIYSTTKNIMCTAMVVEAAARTIPNGIPLHLSRANPQPGWRD